MRNIKYYSHISKRMFRAGITILIGIIFTAYGPLLQRASATQLTRNQLKAMGIYFVSPGDTFNACSSSSDTSSTVQVNKLTAGNKVFIIGDSITVGAASSYTAAFQQSGISTIIDGSTSRSITGGGIDGNKLSALDAVATAEDVAAIQSANAIIIALGTNGNNGPANILKLISSIRSNTTGTVPIYWVDTTTISNPSLLPRIKESNVSIYSQATALNYSVISWYKTVSPSGDPQNPLDTDTDVNGYISLADKLNVHPTAAGIKALTSLVTGTVLGANSNGEVAATGCCSTSITNDASLIGNDNVQKAYNFFLQKGLTPTQSAGIVGNMIDESGVIPKKLQYVYGKETASADIDSAITTVNSDRAARGLPTLSSDSFGFGIVQWTPYKKIVTTARNAGIPFEQIDSLSFQLDQVWGQLTGTGIVGSVSNLKGVGDKLLQTTTIEDATFTFARYFEVFRNSWAFSSYGVKDAARIASDNIPLAEITRVSDAYNHRILNAKDVLATAGQTSSVGAGGTVVSGSTASSCADITPAGQNTRFIDGFTVYSQYDPQWKNAAYGKSTIGDSGCGPSAMAMIITTLTGKTVTPVQTANFAAANGQQITSGGSAWTIAPVLSKNWGLNAQPVNADINAITASLRAGALIIASGTGPEPFTSAGHFIVIRGITADGKLMVGDSAHVNTNTTPYDPSFIISIISQKAGSIYAITK